MLQINSLTMALSSGRSSHLGGCIHQRWILLCRPNK